MCVTRTTVIVMSNAINHYVSVFDVILEIKFQSLTFQQFSFKDPVVNAGR
jgi:hypothetical protein